MLNELAQQIERSNCLDFVQWLNRHQDILASLPRNRLYPVMIYHSEDIQRVRQQILLSVCAQQHRQSWTLIFFQIPPDISSLPETIDTGKAPLPVYSCCKSDEQTVTANKTSSPKFYDILPYQSQHLWQSELAADTQTHN